MPEKLPIPQQRTRQEHLGEALAGLGVLAGLAIAYVALNPELRRRAQQRARDFQQELQQVPDFIRERQEDVQSIARRAQQGVADQLQQNAPRLEHAFVDTFKHIAQELWAGVRRGRTTTQTPEQYITIKDDSEDTQP
jgi:hypothetical protein